MSTEPRRARVRALAKINLSLKVLGKRPDGYHELRTIFQTISLADTIGIEFTPGRQTAIELASNVDIPNNLVVRAARVALDGMKLRGRVSFLLEKRIPAGSGLGGGSSDAAAILLALPVLAGVNVPLGELTALAAELGSDVPFFLLGGTALGLGRGTELYPLPEAGELRGLLVAPEVPIATAEAYQALNRKLTSGLQSPIMNSFQALSWLLDRGLSPEEWSAFGENDFEAFAFQRYPRLAAIRRKLRKAGARPVMLSGSGSALFGIFPRREDGERWRRQFPEHQTEAFRFVSRVGYRRMWWRSLRDHIGGETWPLRSRYAR
jgi:4-diphosphocytidyl-2-C-methyl-D-erythritol kinase